jgi:hypothetical protein
MRNALALALALLASSALPAQAEIQSFFLHFADPAVPVPGGTSPYVIDDVPPSRPAPLVFDQTTPKTETTVFPTFTTPPFATEKTVLPVASVRLTLSANQKMRGCATAGATLFSVGTGGALTPIGTGSTPEANVPQGSSGGTVGGQRVRVEFPLTDTTFAAGEGFALAASLGNDCSINRRTFLAYDGFGGTSGIRFQCCFTAAAKCAGKKNHVVNDATRRLLHQVEKGSRRGEPFDPSVLADVGNKLTQKFARLDATGRCATTGDAPAILAIMAAFVTDLDAALDPLGPPRRNKCQQKKIDAAKKRMGCGLKLEERAAALGEFLDPNPEKLARCKAALPKAFDKVEAKGGCDTTGDLPAIEALANAFVTTVSARLACPCP